MSRCQSRWWRFYELWMGIKTPWGFCMRPWIGPKRPFNTCIGQIKQNIDPYGTWLIVGRTDNSTNIFMQLPTTWTPSSISPTLLEQMQRFKLVWTHVFEDWLLICTSETSYLMSCRATRGKRGLCFLLLIANVGDTPCSQVKKNLCFVLS